MAVNQHNRHRRPGSPWLCQGTYTSLGSTSGSISLQGSSESGSNQAVTSLANHFLTRCVLNHVLHFATLWTVAHQAPLSMLFPMQEYWNGLPFPSPRDLSHPGIEPTSPVSPALAGRVLTTGPPGKLFLHREVRWGCHYSYVPAPLLKNRVN